MKKWLVSMALIVCVLSFTACGSSQETASASAFTPEEEQQWLDSGEAFVKSMDQALENGGIEAYAEDEVLGPALEAYASSKEEMGQINGFEAVSVEKGEDKEVIITVNVDGTDHDAEVIVTVKEEKGDYSITGITTNTLYSFGELMTQAGLNTLMGMGITFAVLGLLILVISLFKLIPLIQARMEEKKRNEAEEAASRNKASLPAPAAPAAVEEEELADDMELVAVIAAAIAAYEGQATADGFVVRSIRKSRKKSA